MDKNTQIERVSTNDLTIKKHENYDENGYLRFNQIGGIVGYLDYSQQEFDDDYTPDDYYIYEDDDYTQIKYLLEKQHFYYFHVTIEPGYYSGFTIDIKNKFDYFFVTKEEFGELETVVSGNTEAIENTYTKTETNNLLDLYLSKMEANGMFANYSKVENTTLVLNADNITN